MFVRMVYKSGQIFLPFCHNTRVWRTDGQTEFSSQYRVDRITCSAVKTTFYYTSAAESIRVSSTTFTYNPPRKLPNSVKLSGR